MACILPHTVSRTSKPRNGHLVTPNPKKVKATGASVPALFFKGALAVLESLM